MTADLTLVLRWTTALALFVLGVTVVWRPKWSEGARMAFAVVLLVNAGLVSASLALVTGLLSASANPHAYSLVLGLFAASPIALGIAVDRVVSPASFGRADAARFAPAGLFVLLLWSVQVLLSADAGLYERVWGNRGALIALHLLVAPTLVRAAVRSAAGPTWLRSVVGLFLAHWLASAASGLTWAFGLPGGAGLELASLSTLLLFGASAGLLALRRGASRLPVYEAPRPEAPASLTDRRLEASLVRLFEEKAVHRDPELTVGALAERVGAGERDVSRVLNDAHGGYHAILRRYRVREAQRLLRERPEATVSSVLYEAGFNSKSAFHRAFEQEVGMTPGAYRATVDSVEQAAAASHFR